MIFIELMEEKKEAAAKLKLKIIRADNGEEFELKLI